MGHKVNPIGLRLGINRTWDSRWFAGRNEYGRLLHEDFAIRAHIMKHQRAAGISKVVIERPHRKCRVTVHSARPGVLIGKKGADIEKLRSELAGLTASEVHLNIVEVRKPEIDATLVAEGIAQQLERRVAFRRAMKRSVQSALRLGALGIRINVSGRLGGAEIARLEWYREGRVPLHTLRADIDFGYGVARTAYGIIGIKVWIFKGEIMEHDPMASERRTLEAQETGGGRSDRGGDRGDRGDRNDRNRRGGRGGRGGGGGGPGGGGGAGGSGGDITPDAGAETAGS
jgi:small subunit ribosomal protein S3